MNLIITGAPGAGKGTIAQIIEEDLDIIHISTGDMLRHHIELKDEIGLKVKDSMDNGILVPESLIDEMVKFRLSQNDVKSKGVLLDGFPRTLDQAKFLLSISAVDGIIEIFLEDDVIVNRLSLRRVCDNCGASYHLEFNKPKVDGVCDVCGHTNLIHRSDDTPDVIKDRLNTYHDETAPVIDFFKEKDVAHLQIRGDLDIASQREFIINQVRSLKK